MAITIIQTGFDVEARIGVSSLLTLFQSALDYSHFRDCLNMPVCFGADVASHCLLNLCVCNVCVLVLE